MLRLQRAIGNQAMVRALSGTRAAVQPKLTIGRPDDPYEREADRAAARVMGMPKPHPGASPNPTEGPSLRRKCACGGSCADCRTDGGGEPVRLQAKPNGTGGSDLAEAPPIVHDALRSPGQPLDRASRAFFEPRFGHDFSGVRIHTDGLAAASADAVGARAYTVGRDVVFAKGQYSGATFAERSLLAHELAHVAQQGGEPAWLQRACAPSLCPAAPVEIDALFPRYEAAEKCIQDLYASSHPAKRGISLSFNADWLHLTGGSPQQRLALGCLRGEETPGAGPNFTAKHGMFAGEPDIWDFLNKTMYEITTLSGSAMRIGKLGFELALANKICGPMECGGFSNFDRGTWAPAPGCYALGGDLYFTARNNQGVIIYTMLKDATKELVLAMLLALMANAMKKAGPKLGAQLVGRTVGARVLGKAVPAYAIASLAAVAILLGSGRAEAKMGPGEEEPLVQLFKAMEQKGTPVPKEIQDMLEANPDLKQKLDAAMKQGGDPSKLQEEMNKQILDTIAANKDSFTPEELELLLATTRAAGKALPKGDYTAEELKKLAEAAKAGKTGDGSGKKAGDANGGDQPKAPRSDAPGQGGATDRPAPPISGSPISEATRGTLAKAPGPVRELFNSLVGSGPKGLKLTDSDVQRFLSIVPPSLTSDEAARLSAKLKAAEGVSVSQILDSLQSAVSDLKKGQATASSDPQGKPRETATLSTDPNAPAAVADPDKLIKDLAAEAKTPSAAPIAPGDFRITWRPRGNGAPAVGETIKGSLRGKLKDGKTSYAGRVEAIITAVDGAKLKVKFTTSSPWVAADGRIVFPASTIVGREDSIVLDTGATHRKK